MKGYFRIIENVYCMQMFGKLGFRFCKGWYSLQILQQCVKQPFGQTRTIWTSTGFRQLHTGQCYKVDPDLIKTTKVGNIFIFKFYCTCTSQGIFRFLGVIIYIVCTWIYLIGTEIVGSTLGATDEVRVDPPILHHQSNKNYLTQCFIYD